MRKIVLALCLLPLMMQAQTKYIQAVDEYMPAPGQFVNTLPEATADDTPATMARKCTERLAGGAGQMVTLGAYGGYITFHFDHPVANIPGQMDLYIAGNANINGSEAGIVMVSQDANRNGLPDDVWYELSGSADTDSTGLVAYGYEIVYHKSGDRQDIAWTDNRGTTGIVPRNGFHQQEYFPLWLDGDLAFSGTLLPANAQMRSSTNWLLNQLRSGYADNWPNADTLANSFNIDWAVEPVSRRPVALTHVDFIRVYTALNQVCGWLGETSTEITAAEDLHLEASLLQSASVPSVAILSQHPAQPPLLHDLQGRRVAHPSRGLYIQNRRKVFINHH